MSYLGKPLFYVDNLMIRNCVHTKCCLINSFVMSGNSSDKNRTMILMFRPPSPPNVSEWDLDSELKRKQKGIWPQLRLKNLTKSVL
jgi:hypothetical protein